jgi:hypothetical protein
MASWAVDAGRSVDRLTIGGRRTIADIGAARDVRAICDVRPLAAGADIGPVDGAGLQHLLPASAAKIHARLRAAGDVAGAGKFLCDSGVVVSHAVSVDWIESPVSDLRIVDVHRAIDVDVVASPIEAAAPTIAAARPIPERIARAEGQSGCKEAGSDIVRRPEIIGRIVGIGPRAVNDRRIVVRHVEHVRLGWLDIDDLRAPYLLGRHGLLLVRG